MANTGVTGRVVFAGTSNGIPNLLVTAVDIDPITSDDLLGSTLTDSNGNFSMSYSPGDYRIWSVAGEDPDIEVRIFGEGDRLLWETRLEPDVQIATLDVGTIQIHKNNFRVPDATSTPAQRKQDEYWLATHTTFDPANGAAVRLTRGNQIDWLVDGSVLFPDITQKVIDAQNSVKLMNMAFDAGDFISDFDFGTKNHQTVEKDDVVVVRKLGDTMVGRATGIRVHVLLWELEESIDAPIGSLFDLADKADEFRKFFGSTFVQIATLKTSQLLHVKLIVVDGKIGYITGSTMKQGYFADQDHLLRDGRHGVVDPKSKKGDRQLTHDVSLRVQGPSVRFIDETFSTIWNAASDPAPAPAPQVGPIGGPDAPIGVQVLRTLPGGLFTTPTPNPNVENLPHGETGILESYQRAILKAEEFIYIEDQYFNSPEIAAAIQQRMIEKPLLEVILVLNTQPDIGGYHQHQTALIKELFAALGNQPNRLGVFTMWSTDASQPKFEVAHVYMHSKVAIVDDFWASVGTANVDGASMNQRQWRIILPGLLEDVNAAIFLLFPIVMLVLLVTAPVLLMDQNIRSVVIDAITREFARFSQHATPHRERQPSRHCEINMVVYNDIAGQPQTDKVKELRESLWTEMLGAPPPATRPSAGWVSHWKSRADDLKSTIVNASQVPPTVVPTKSKILEWIPQRDYEKYLRSLGVKTKNIVVRKSGVTMPFEVA